MTEWPVPVQLATDFAIETIAKHPIQGHFAAVLVHQKTNAMVCSAARAPPPPCGSPSLTASVAWRELQALRHMHGSPHPCILPLASVQFHVPCAQRHSDGLHRSEPNPNHVRQTLF